ncbi:EF-hand domain-containing protein [Pseudoxanthomonas sp. 10H]|uniref:EF-hand domain-containing protein n=1 Tax=Pseudoxanthomonas sp. 10H TaxID=3242729 RepID=UPI00355684BF
MNTQKRLTTGLLILGMATAPLAFAQQDTSATRAESPQATGAAEQQPAQSTAGGQGLSWADLDADGNGTLSKQEAQRHAGLSNVYADADADANGELTADEYRGFVQKRQATTPTTP